MPQNIDIEFIFLCVPLILPFYCMYFCLAFYFNSSQITNTYRWSFFAFYNEFFCLLIFFPEDQFGNWFNYLNLLYQIVKLTSCIIAYYFFIIFSFTFCKKNNEKNKKKTIFFNFFFIFVFTCNVMIQRWRCMMKNRFARVNFSWSLLLFLFTSDEYSFISTWPRLNNLTNNILHYRLQDIIWTICVFSMPKRVINCY